MTTRMSSRQFQMLEQLGSVAHISFDEASSFNQSQFRSMLVRKYMSYRHGKGFYITPLGQAARQEFYEADILRKNRNLPLTAYFDAEAYGLAPRRKPAIVHVLNKRGAA